MLDHRSARAVHIKSRS